MGASTLFEFDALELLVITQKRIVTINKKARESSFMVFSDQTTKLVANFTGFLVKNLDNYRLAVFGMGLEFWT